MPAATKVATATKTSADPFSGVGISSVSNIKKAAAKSGEVPPLIDTNDYDPPPEGGGYHLTGNAVDWSNGDDVGTPEMDRFASWVASTWGSASLEIIHVNQDGTTVEWKMGQQMPSGWYGQSTLAQHKNHVHWAITNAGLNTTPGTAAATGTSPAVNPAGDIEQTSVLTSWVQPVIDFLVSAGLVVGGVALILFGFTILFHVKPPAVVKAVL